MLNFYNYLFTVNLGRATQLVGTLVECSPAAHKNHFLDEHLEIFLLSSSYLCWRHLFDNRCDDLFKWWTLCRLKSSKLTQYLPGLLSFLDLLFYVPPFCSLVDQLCELILPWGMLWCSSSGFMLLEEFGLDVEAVSVVLVSHSPFGGTKSLVFAWNQGWRSTWYFSISFSLWIYTHCAMGLVSALLPILFWER